jgi:ribosomal protein L37E
MSRAVETSKRQARGTALNDAPEIPADCAHCAFWRRMREYEGSCRRRAPEADQRAEQVAHWPQTHSRQWCGEGALAVSPAPASTCADCRYWRHPEGGLNPVDRGDMPMAWWALAGYCARHAPKPVPEPGARAFWRATHSADSCGEGVSRRTDAPTAQ